MASAYFANEVSASPVTVKILLIGGWFSITCLLSGCGYADLKIRHLNFDKTKAKSNQLAVLSVNHDDDETTSPYVVELVRGKGAQKGYGVRTPIYEEEKGVMHFTVAKQREYKWFVGVQGRWEF